MTRKLIARAAIRTMPSTIIPTQPTKKKAAKMARTARTTPRTRGMLIRSESAGGCHRDLRRFGLRGVSRQSPSYRPAERSGKAFAQAEAARASAHRMAMLQFGRPPQGERDTLFRESDDLGVGVAGGRPALYVGGLGPPAVALAVVEESDGLVHVRWWRGPTAPKRDGRSPHGLAGCRQRVARPWVCRRSQR